MADIEELVLKVGVEVDAEQLKRLRDEIKRMQESSSKNAIKLGLIGSQSSSHENTNISSKEGIINNYSDEIVALLSLSEKHLMEILNVTKQDHEKKQRKTDAEDNNNKSKGGGPLPFAQNIADSSLPSIAGGAIGGVVGAIAGGNVLLGAQIGGAIGTLIETITGNIKTKTEEVAKLFDQRLMEDIHFRQLNQQTGMTVDNLYKLQQQAKLAGTSLEEVVDSNQHLSDELIGGISEKKAQLLMALNINPRQALMESGGDISQLNQMIFERAHRALRGANPYYKTSALGLLGYSPEEQTSRQFLYRGDVKDRAQQIHDVATNNGKTPFVTGEQLQAEILKFKGSELEFLAGIREALTTQGLAAKLSTKLMEVKAETVNIISGAINDIAGKGLRGDVPTADTINKENIRKNIEAAKNPHNNPYIYLPTHNDSPPASGSGSAKAGAAQ